MSSATSIHQNFQELIDPRVSRTQKHDCLNIVAITLCAIICGADNWVAIEVWFLGNQDNKQGLLPLHQSFE